MSEVTQVTQFLLELGTGFAYVGRQFPLRVGTSDFYIDLLFYHMKLHCYVVIELKTTAFQPEFAGKLNKRLIHRLDQNKIIRPLAS